MRQCFFEWLEDLDGVCVLCQPGLDGLGVMHPQAVQNQEQLANIF